MADMSNYLRGVTKFSPSDLDKIFVAIEIGFLEVVYELLDRLKKPLKTGVFSSFGKGTPSEIPLENITNDEILTNCKRNLSPIYEALSYLVYVHMFQSLSASSTGETRDEEMELAKRVQVLKGRMYDILGGSVLKEDRDIPDTGLINVEDKELYGLRKKFCSKASKTYLQLFGFNDAPTTPECNKLIRLENLATNSRTGKKGTIRPMLQKSNMDLYVKQEKRKGDVLYTSASKARMDDFRRRLEALKGDRTPFNYEEIKAQLDALKAPSFGGAGGGSAAGGGGGGAGGSMYGGARKTRRTRRGRKSHKASKARKTHKNNRHQ